MQYAELKEELKSIAELAASLPEPFQHRCFELLLTHLLARSAPPPPPPPPASVVERQAAASSGRETDAEGGDIPKLPLPAQVRVFMRKTAVTEEQLATILTIEDGEVHFLKEPAPGKIAQGQIQWSLLLALKAAFVSNTFAVDPEAVRSVCQEKGFYDKANFAANFKTAANVKLFKRPLESQGEQQSLSSEGLDALGVLVKDLAAAK